MDSIETLNGQPLHEAVAELAFVANNYYRYKTGLEPHPAPFARTHPALREGFLRATKERLARPHAPSPVAKDPWEELRNRLFENVVHAFVDASAFSGPVVVKMDNVPAAEREDFLEKVAALDATPAALVVKEGEVQALAPEEPICHPEDYANGTCR